MSDNDDIEVDSDEDSSRYHNVADKRAHHNALERKRRDHIKDSFHSLRESVPACKGKVGREVASLLRDARPPNRDQCSGIVARYSDQSIKQASRAQILDKATDYIQYMRRKNHTTRQAFDDLKRQNALLEQSR
ncbi:LOW QUALITY PROTEIN: protein max [Salvelinus sp. IW2-2015]|uniref:LOW QUALITY PROTEIN: protein max n=1 Tax=Salvelinus sp. IW2-2015 TaxID=2691554 RepID=UPI0038D358CC